MEHTQQILDPSISNNSHPQLEISAPASEQLLHSLFEEFVKLRPNDIAVKHGSKTITFTELDARATIVSQKILSTYGFNPGMHNFLYLLNMTV
jgi:non-ribosomal peptide synthetase component F